jgi:hypothetical protein
MATITLTPKQTRALRLALTSYEFQDLMGAGWDLDKTEETLLWEVISIVEATYPEGTE